MGRRTVTGSTLTDSAGPSSLPVAGLAHNPRNARDDYSDVAELAESIRQTGILQPLSVVRQETFLSHFPEHEHDIGVRDWVVIAGNRRLAAAREAGLVEVPVIAVDRLGRDGMLDEAVLVENIHRADLPPLREAEVLRMLVKRHGSQAEVARRITKTRAFVSQRLKLLELSAADQAALRDGTLSLDEARALARKPAAPAAVNAVYETPDAARRPVRRPAYLRRPPGEVAAEMREYLTPDEFAAFVRLLTTDP